MGIETERIINNEGYEDLADFLQQLLEREELEDPTVKGIAKQTIDRGIDSLSEKQKDVIYKTADKYKTKHKCELCSNDNVSGLMDYINIADFGICPTCENIENKYMDD